MDLEKRIAETPLASPPRSEFRAEVRTEFLSLAGDADGTLQPQPRLRPVSRLRQVVVIGLAVAAAVLVTLFVPNDPTWTVLDMPGEGPIEVAGVSFTGPGRGRVGVELSEGAQLSSLARTVSFELEDWMRVRVRPGTEVAFERLPEMSTAEPIRIHVTQGEVFVETLAEYPGNPILIETPDAVVTVTGTVLGVLVDEQGTCTCVARGEVVVDDPSGQEPQELVKATHSYRIFRGQSMPAKRLDFNGMGDPAHIAHTSLLTDFAGGS